MSSKFATARAALYTAVDAVSNVRGYRYEVDKPEASGAVVGAVVRFPETSERMDQRGGWRYIIPVLVFAQRSVDRTADAALEAACDAIVDGLESDANGNGTIDYAVFIGANGYDLVEVAGIAYLGVVLRFEVVA